MIDKNRFRTNLQALSPQHGLQGNPGEFRVSWPGPSDEFSSLCHTHVCMAKSLVNVTFAEVFDIQRTQLAPGFMPYIRFEYRVDFTEIFKFETHSMRILSIFETIFLSNLSNKRCCSLLVSGPIVHIHSIF